MSWSRVERVERVELRAAVGSPPGQCRQSNYPSLPPTVASVTLFLSPCHSPAFSIHLFLSLSPSFSSTPPSLTILLASLSLSLSPASPSRLVSSRPLASRFPPSVPGLLLLRSLRTLSAPKLFFFFFPYLFPHIVHTSTGANRFQSHVPRDADNITTLSRYRRFRVG